MHIIQIHYIQIESLGVAEVRDAERSESTTMGGPGRAFVHQSRGGLGRAARLNAARRAGWGGWRGRAPQRGRSGEGSEVEFRAVMGDNDGGR